MNGVLISSGQLLDLINDLGPQFFGLKEPIVLAAVPIGLTGQALEQRLGKGPVPPLLFLDGHLGAR